MATLKNSDKRILEDALEMRGGYVLDFTDRTFSDFFHEKFGIEIYEEKYGFNGSSKAKHLRALFHVEDEAVVAKVARSLWAHRESLERYADTSATLKQRFFDLVNRLEGTASVVQTDALERFKLDETLEELISAIERDVSAGKPEVALDRFHTYCMKKFAYLLDVRQIPWNKDDPLQSRVGRYVRSLENTSQIRPISRFIIKSSISVFDQLNDVRNNKSLAHDNDLMERAEARFVFEGISAFLRFVKAIEASYEGGEPKG